MTMKKYCFFLTIVLLNFGFLASMEEKKLEKILCFDFLFNALKEDDTKAAFELIKKGVSAAIAIDVPEEVKKKITGVSYKSECIDIKNLSFLKIIHWGFDEKLHLGEMIVNKKVANEVVDIFTDLLKAKYAIEKIKLIDEYNANDDKSMEDNNSSALCCRPVTGQEKMKNPTWSLHSYGTAIDINPKQNPYIKPKVNLILPKNAAEYIDRSKVRKGMIIKDDVCYTAFTKRGWTWGGDWDIHDAKGRIDLQHFQKE
jgi:hypothetical protein